MCAAVASVLAVLLAVVANTRAAGRQLTAKRGEQLLVSWSPAASNGLSLQPADDPAAGSLLTWWLGFNESTVTVGASGTTFTQNPHTASLPPGEATQLGTPGTLDHVKHLAVTAPYDASPTRRLAFSVKMSSQSFIPANLPYTVANSQDDFRLGACATIFIDFSNMITVDTFMTNTGIWALYERLPFARTSDHIYAAFTMVKRIASRANASQMHDLKTTYDQSKNTLAWWVDGERKHKVNKIGFRAPHMSSVLDLGGVEEEVILPSLSAGFGCFTLLDGADPNVHKSRAGLLDLNPTAASSPEVYRVPSSWQVDTRANTSAIHDPAWRLFGQGTSMTLSAFKVAYE